MRASILTAATLFTGLFLLPITGLAEDTTEKGFALMKAESLGGLKLDMPASAVSKLLGKPGKTGQDVMWEAIGMYVQEWIWPGQGVELQMSSEKKKGSKTVFAITVTAPSQFATAKGIHIGSSEAEVRKAYASYKDKEASKSGEAFVAGTVYGGLIFTIKDGKVEQIFLGAAAE